MKQVIYHRPETESPDFCLEWSEEGQITSIKSPADSFGMNWTRGKKRGEPFAQILIFIPWEPVLEFIQPFRTIMQMQEPA